jgi:hypothetical protein
MHKLSWILRLICVFILGQSLFFKFSAAPESIFIFGKLGVEPWGRYFAGLSELVACLLLLYSPLSWLGSLLSAGIMVGAMASHIFVLGIEVQNDGGLLFGLAFAVFLAASINLFLERNKIPYLRGLK